MYISETQHVQKFQFDTLHCCSLSETNSELSWYQHELTLKLKSAKSNEDTEIKHLVCRAGLT